MQLLHHPRMVAGYVGGLFNDSAGAGADGTFDGDELVVNFTGLAPVDTDTPAAVLDVILSAGNDTAVIQDGPMLGMMANLQSTQVVDIAGTFETFSFTRKDLVRFSSLDGADHFTLNNPTPELDMSGAMAAVRFEFYGHDITGTDVTDDGAADTFNIAATGAVLTTDVFGGDGNDVINIGQSNLLVSSFILNNVTEFNGISGAFDSVFATGSGLNGPNFFTFGPDGNLYVASRFSNQVLRYNGSTGAFIDEFVTAGSGGLDEPIGVTFGADGNLYVGSSESDQVLRYDGTTGAFLDVFVTPASGGLDRPLDLIFGPDGNLYVSSANSNEILRYNGTTGTFIDAFVTANLGGLDNPHGLVFDANGNLYVSSFTTNDVKQFSNTGAFIGVFVTATSGGLSEAIGLVFGPDGNLYVSSLASDQVLRYDGTSGAFLDVFASGGAFFQTVDIGFAPPTLDGILGAININGEDNDAAPTMTATVDLSVTVKGATVSNTFTQTIASGDTLNLADAGSTANNAYTLTDTTFQRTAAVATGLITFATVETINITTGTGNDTFATTDTPNLVKVTIDTGAGADTVSFTTTGTSSIVQLNSGIGNDTITVTTTGGGDSILEVNASEGADSITLTNSGNGDGVRLIGGDGSDTINVTTTGTLSGTEIFGNDPAAPLLDADDDDSITISNTGMESLMEISGNEGEDTITLVTSGDISAVQLAGDEDDDLITVNNSGDVSLLLIQGGDGDSTGNDPFNDIINIEGTDSASLTDAFGGTGNDQFNIGDTTNGLDDILGEICVFGEADDTFPTSSFGISAKAITNLVVLDGDELNILDDASTSSSTYTITDTTIDRTGITQITYATIETLNINTSDTTSSSILVTTTAANVTTINAGNMADDIDITTTGSSSVVIVNAGGGADTIDVANTDITSLTFLNGEAGNDSITVMDPGTGGSIQISGGTDDDSITINNFNGFVLSVDGDAGADVITLEGIGVGRFADLFGSEGNDTFNLGDITNGLDDILGFVCVFGEDNLAAPTNDLTIKGSTNSLAAGDELILNDASGSGGTYTLSDTTFSRTGTGSVTYATTETVRLNIKNDGGSTVNVTNTVASGSTFIRAQALVMPPGDIVNVTTTGFRSSLTINMASGADSITIANTGIRAFTQVNAGGGSDTVNLTSTGQQSFTELNGQAGTDTLNLLALGGNPATSLGAASELCVNGNDGDDTITMTFLADQRLNSRALVMLNGGGNSDDLVIDSSADTLNRTAEVQTETTDGTDVMLRDFGGTAGMIEIDDTEEYQFRGGTGSDLLRIRDTAGNDTITVGDVGSAAQNDIVGYECVHLVGTAGNDTLSLALSTNVAIGSVIEGGAGNDVMKGGAGQDAMYGGAGMDNMMGLAGNDFFFPDGDLDGTLNIAAGDVIDGGAGFDQVSGCAADTLISIEKFRDCRETVLVIWMSGQVISDPSVILGANALPCTIAARTRTVTAGPTAVVVMHLPALPAPSVVAGESATVELAAENAQGPVEYTAELMDESKSMGSVEVEGNTLTVRTNSGFAGMMMVKVTAQDGANTAISMVEVQVSAAPVPEVLVEEPLTPATRSRLDVNRDGSVNVNDAVSLIYMLLTEGLQAVPSSSANGGEGEPGGMSRYDVDGNGLVNNVDALTVINHLLNEASSASPAGSQPAPPPAAAVPESAPAQESTDAAFAEMAEGEPNDSFSDDDFASLGFAMSIQEELVDANHPKIRNF